MCVLHTSQLCSIRSSIMNLGTARVGYSRPTYVMFATFNVNLICPYIVSGDIYIVYIIHCFRKYR